MEPKLHIISCLGFKGGTGRTTTSAALAFGLASFHIKIPTQIKVHRNAVGSGGVSNWQMKS